MSPPGPADGPGSFFDELRRGLEHRADRTRERVDERIWGPVRELAARLGERAGEARHCDDPLRDAGRALRMACDEIETLSLAAVLGEELRAHLEDVLPLAHALPRTMELPDEGGGRRVPARAAATAVLRGEYPAALAARLRPEALVVAPASSLPPAPADLLGEEDWQARLAGAVEGASEHLSRLLDDLAAEATDRLRHRLLSAGPFTHLRARWRDSRARREREEALDALRRSLADADGVAAAELRRRRLAADLARRERALREMAAESAELARGLAGEATRIRRIAEGLDALASGERALPTEEGAGASALVERIQAALEERRQALGPASPDGERLEAAMVRLAQRAAALGGVAEDFLAREGGAPEPAEADRPQEPEGELAQLVRRACEELATELHARLDAAREGLRESGEIVRHGVEAARAGTSEPEETAHRPTELDAEAARDACRRAAHRLRDTAATLETELETTAVHLESVPDKILAAIRERLVPGHGAGRRVAPGALGAGESRPSSRGVRRLMRRARIYLRVAWRAVVRSARSLETWVRRLLAVPATAPEREGQQARRPGGGADAAAFVAELEAGSDLSGLPANYRWLFRPEPLDDPRLMIGRGDALDRLRAVRTRLEAGASAAVAVVGGPGSGKTTLLNALVSEIGAEVAVRSGTIDRRLVTRSELLEWLGSFLFPAAGDGVPGGRPRFTEPAALGEALGERRELVLLEKGERLFRREVGGYGALTALTEVMEATSGRVGWIMTFETPSWRFIRRVSSLPGAFDRVLELGPLSRSELEEAIMARHRLTGYDLEFDPPQEGLSTRQTARLRAAGEEERQASLRDRCFDHVHGDGDRDVGEALFLWRRCVRSDPGRPAIVVARPTPIPEPTPLEELDRAVLFVLAALAIHGDLDRAAATAAAGGSAGPGAVHLLETSGLLERVEGPSPAPLRVRPFLHRLVTNRLKSANVLPLAGGER